MKFFLFFFALSLFALHAKPIDTNASYIDSAHKIISDKVTDYSRNIDQQISKVFAGETQAQKETEKQNSYDSFFKNEKYLDETEKSFVSINIGTQLQSKYKNKNKLAVNAYIDLKRTNKKLNLFISGGNENKNNRDKNNATEVGVNYFRSDTYKIKSRYSLGIRAFYLFFRARYYKVFTTKNWKIEPMQIFEYSSKNIFKENSFIYFDKTLEDTSLLRFTLHRGTQSNLTGMDYDISTQYYWNSHKKNVFTLSETLSGNTKYQVVPSSKIYRGINNYTTSLTMRRNVWKKWFFYQISPSVNFHKENSYKANYAINFFINLYFGHI